MVLRQRMLTCHVLINVLANGGAVVSEQVGDIVKASQVRVRSTTGEVVGAGFLITDYVVCTSAQVVARALGVSATGEAPDGPVDVEFPLLDGQPRVRTDVVSWRFGRLDVALLNLHSGVEGTTSVPIFRRTARPDYGFSVFGYPEGADHGIWATGALRDRHASRWKEMDMLARGPHTRLPQIFTGSPVWNEAENRVFGMMVDTSQGENLPYLLPMDTLLNDPILNLRCCPFKGFSAYTENDAESFYGRDSDVLRTLSAVRAQPMTIVMGPSGCGKSSLVRAGVLPRLRARGMSISELRPMPGKPATSVLAPALAEVLDPRLDEAARLIQAEELAELLKIHTMHAVGKLRAGILARGGIGRVLFVDQFEDYADAAPAAARDLAGLLDALADGCHVAGLRVVTTARPGTLRELGTDGAAIRVSSKVCELAPLTRDDLRRAMSGPVDAMPRLSFEPGLPERILADAGDEPGRMSLVQAVLSELWTKRGRSMLTHSAYDAMGGVAGIAVQQATTYVSQDQWSLAQRLFVQLARPGDGNAFSRRSARVADLAPELINLARELAPRRLVVLSHAPGGAEGEEIVELPHEALIQQWPLLRQWLVDCRDFRSWQEQLRADLRRWQAQPQDSARLLSGSDLLEALHRFDEHLEDLSADERDYILLSSRRHGGRAGRALQAASDAMGRAEAPLGQGRGSEGRPHWQVLTVVGLWVAVLLAAASFSVREVLDSVQQHAQLGPSDTPAVVTAIVALATATGTLIGVVLTSYAKYVQARGQADADLIRARAELMRARADVTRARAGLPPHTSSANGTSPALTPPAEPDTNQPPPSVGFPDAS
ncbi:ATP-binding protein [Streptomyces sp. WM6378]|uniref:nSTAND1 domain-containing NTPase n=1 Tax=Streptomyces sp. WM6378 TaxID=1415557 RepID=UPI0006AE2969|nr:ATP-binding protein [Streptomyces sp. WM6378]KOU43563.1 hypothetical protein ADK54_17360 [Streptomyces sp. WM6378]